MPSPQEFASTPLRVTAGKNGCLLGLDHDLAALGAGRAGVQRRPAKDDW